MYILISVRACDFLTQPLNSTYIKLTLQFTTSDIMARGKRTSKLQDAVSAAPDPDINAAEVEAEIPDDIEQRLDPSTSERRYWRDPLTGVQREIWRPGTFTLKVHPLGNY